MVKHLAMIAGGATWRSINLAMFTAYFDASGDEHEQLALVVAGFIASAEAWIDWEREWLERLAIDGLAYFHRNELGGWPQGKRERLIGDLCQIIREHVAYKIGIAIVNEDLHEVVSSAELREWRIKSYSVLGRTAAKEARCWATSSYNGPIPKLVFEKGDVGSGDLKHLLESQGYPSPIFEPKKKQVDRKSGITLEPAVPLKAADLLAHEIFTRVRTFEKTGEKSRLPESLHKIPGDPGCMEKGHLRFLRELFEQSHEPLIVTTAAKILDGAMWLEP